MKLHRWGWCLLTLAAVASAQSIWLDRVPAADRARQNPLAGQPPAIAAGRELYLEKCAKCHGEQAEGRGARPSLHSERTAHEQDGDFYWILEHGSKFNGMPAWSSLPEQQIWQLVAYLRSIQPAANSSKPALIPRRG